MNTGGGYFNGRGGYVVTDDGMGSAWEYIYQNGDVLLRVDQNGPISAQLAPPEGIMLFKRELSDKYSKWLAFIDSGDRVYCNFRRPELSSPAQTSKSQEPKTRIEFMPERAVYEYRYDDVQISTSFFVPSAGAQIVMRLSVKNLSDSDRTYKIMPALYPYMNQAQLAPWDKYEWYLRTGYFAREDFAAFYTRLGDAHGNKANRRAAALYADNKGLTSVEYCMDKYLGAGDFNRPDSLKASALRLAPTGGRFGEFSEQSISGYPPVYALCYSVNIKAGEEGVLSFVLSAQELDNGEFLPNEEHGAARLLRADIQQSEIAKRAAHFEKTLGLSQIALDGGEFDSYVNGFLPLQMQWVSALDRGWPTGMRGVRDAANDFMGALLTNHSAPRDILKLLLSCQRSDGWFPRQISTKGASGRHDLREYADGGAFVWELIYEYLCASGDQALLGESIGFLDGGNASVARHAVLALEYYLNPENIGQHGLCKIREGDWLDAVNRAGVLGRGESVMLSCQAIMALKYLLSLYNYLAKPSLAAGLMPISHYESALKSLIKAVKGAVNSEGFYNGVFTDGGEWIFSSADPDGVSRLYAPTNCYAVISGVEDKPQALLSRAMERLGSEAGYRLFSPPFTGAIKNVGRIAGDVPAGLWENGAVYNHGSQGFLCRALASAGMAEELFKAINYMLPFNQECHPLAKTQSAPYAVVNCWQDIPEYRHRGGMPFLTGSIAMAMRAVYSWMFGIKPVMEGICFLPCLPKRFKTAGVRYYYGGKSLEISYNICGEPPCAIIDGEKITATRADCLTGKSMLFIERGKLTGAKIEIRS